jgi:quinol monooxygenase YgiN
VVALLKISPDQLTNLEPFVKNLAEKSRAEEGVARYEVYRIREQEGVYLFLEQYKNQQAREFHTSTEHFLSTMAACTPYFLEEPVVVSLEKEPI